MVMVTMIRGMMTTNLVAMAVAREAITIAKMVEVMKRNQEMERKMKVQMFRSENWRFRKYKLKALRLQQRKIDEGRNLLLLG
jgi:hypothetical protein